MMDVNPARVLDVGGNGPLGCCVAPAAAASTLCLRGQAARQEGACSGRRHAGEEFSSFHFFSSRSEPS
jgi:hypothetical protein